MYVLQVAAATYVQSLPLWHPADVLVQYIGHCVGNMFKRSHPILCMFIAGVSPRHHICEQVQVTEFVPASINAHPQSCSYLCMLLLQLQLQLQQWSTGFLLGTHPHSQTAQLLSANTRAPCLHDSAGVALGSCNIHDNDIHGMIRAVVIG